MAIRKRFGQHFLHDAGVVRRIVEAVAPAAGEHIVEVGPGRGAITFTAHYGCWEVLPSFIMHHSKIGGIVARPLDNPRLEELIGRTRSLSRTTIIPRRNMLRQGLKLLHEKGVLGILIDQNVSLEEGTFVDFFGTPACAGTASVCLPLSL